MAHCLWSCVTLLCLFNLILEVTDGLSLPEPSPRACIIGAGYTGLGTARYMKEYGVNFTVFEATKHVGGTWRFDRHIGTDEDSVPVFTRMYKNLRVNTPTLTMEYSGYPFPKDAPSYPTGVCFYKYIKSFAKNFDLLKYIQFQSMVTSVKWTGSQWSVTFRKTDTKSSHTEVCDYVIVATGTYHKTNVPNFEGMKSFKGNLIHSSDYRDPEPYRNRSVLLVGAGASGLDLAMHLSNITSKLVHSHHLNYNQPNFPDTYVKKPDIKAFTDSGVVFKDGSFEEVDDVILATGYRYNFPFIDESAGITTTEKFVLPLYQQVLNIKRPSMAFVGISQTTSTRLCETQGQYVAAMVARRFKLPTQETMLKNWLDHVYHLQARNQKIIHVNVIGSAQDEYFANLTKQADIVRPLPVMTTIRDFNAKYRLEDLFGYREYNYKIIDDYNYEKHYVPRSEYPCPIEED